MHDRGLDLEGDPHAKAGFPYQGGNRFGGIGFENGAYDFPVYFCESGQGADHGFATMIFDGLGDKGIVEHAGPVRPFDDGGGVVLCFFLDRIGAFEPTAFFELLFEKTLGVGVEAVARCQSPDQGAADVGGDTAHRFGGQFGSQD